MAVKKLKNSSALSIKSGSLKDNVTSATSLLAEAVYYVDATAPTNWGSLGYVYLNGVSGNYLSVPDSSALDITGDIDLRLQLALDDWSPSASQRILVKGGTSQQSYELTVSHLPAGYLVLRYSTDGTTLTSVASTTAVSFTDGSVGWIRGTRVASTGLVKFFTSTDGTNWTQLGSDVAGTSGNIFSGTGNVFIGQNFDGGNPMLGKLYRAQVLSGVGGTTVLDVNIATDYSSSRLDTFTATTGQTVTVNGVGVVNNLGTAGSLLPTTVGSSTAADSNDPKFLDFTGTNYVYLPGVAQNRLSVPDADALDITGDIDLRAYVAMDDWTPAATSTLIAKRASSGQVSYQLRVTASTGILTFVYSIDGTTTFAISSTVAPTVADGASLWVRVTVDVDNGASGNDAKFYTSTNGSTWTQLGTTVTTAGVISLYSSTSPVEIGSALAGTDSPLAGKVFRAQIFNGIDGTKVLDVDTSVITAGSATSFTAVTGQTVTINRSTSGRKTVAVTQPVWLFGTDDYMEVNNRYISTSTPTLYLPGIASNNATTPDAAALDITGDIDIRVKVALDDWTPSSTQYLVAKLGASGARSYGLQVNTDGRLVFVRSTDGSATTSVFSGVTAVPFADGATGWVRVTFDVDNGAGGNDTIFYTSTDGSTWTQLGTTQTNAGTTATFSGAANLEIGTGFVGASGLSRGEFFRAQVLNGIDGTVAFDADFETSITSLLQTSFTESSANAATVTINRSGSTYRSAGITTSGYLYPGATNTFTASATDYLNFGASDSFSVMTVFRQFGTNTVYVLAKRTGTTGGIPGYSQLNIPNSTLFAIGDGAVSPNNATASFTSGSLTTSIGIRNVSTDNIQITNNGVSGTAQSDITTATISTISSFRIGANSFSTSSAMEGEIYAAAVFRSVLTASQLRQISNYFANREVYL